MKILAIETSCDDTGVAILETPAAARGFGVAKKSPRFEVLSNIISSQTIHSNYGGVFPMMAKREHQRNLPIVLKKALEEGKLLKMQKSKVKSQKFNSKLKIIERILKKESELFELTREFLETHKKPAVDVIAVTNGPGLEPCLYVGVNFAKALSYVWNIPVIPVNHIEAHILVNFMKHETWNMKQTFPAVSLVVSGGHTQLILVKKIGDYKIIGETRDDAAGECFDKAARILHLGYPGGPIISKIASQIKESSITLPRPMIHSKDYDFSFSGLKTSVLYKVRGTKPEELKSETFIQQMCFAVQDAICDVLVKKTIAAAKSYKAKTIILGGGVSANQELRKQLKEKIKKEIPNTKYVIPDTALSTDNALMIAVTGYFHTSKKTTWKKLKVDANLRI